MKAPPSVPRPPPDRTKRLRPPTRLQPTATTRTGEPPSPTISPCQGRDRGARSPTRPVTGTHPPSASVAGRRSISRNNAICAPLNWAIVASARSSCCSIVSVVAVSRSIPATYQEPVREPLHRAHQISSSSGWAQGPTTKTQTDPTINASNARLETRSKASSSCVGSQAAPSVIELDARSRLSHVAAGETRNRSGCGARSRVRRLGRGRRCVALSAGRVRRRGHAATGRAGLRRRRSGWSPMAGRRAVAARVRVR